MNVVPLKPRSVQAHQAENVVPASERSAPAAARYAELHCLSDFSFQRGAASAGQLFERAAACGYEALAITDECSLAGIVRAHEASRRTGVRLVIGTELRLEDGPCLVVLARERRGYEEICRIITHGRRAASKGCYRLTRADFAGGLPGTTVLLCPGRDLHPEEAQWARATFDDLRLAVELLRDSGDDAARLCALQALGRDLAIPLVAAGDVHMDTRRRRALQDAMTAIRQGVPLSEAGAFLHPNGERHIRAIRSLTGIYPAELLNAAADLAAECQFDLTQLQYRYPAEVVGEGHTPASWLRSLTEAGCAWRWPEGVPPKAAAQIEHELALIAELQYEAYFLTVHDIVRFARDRQILCQGRGSAANSAVCFALGITEVDPMRMDMLMERFISKERAEPPDIDIDFEHERREEVIQYIYQKYGRDRAALAATVICYRGRSAARDAARVLGMTGDGADLLAGCIGWWDGEAPLDDRLREAGFDPETPILRRILWLTRQLLDRPRHLSQHVGGFVISDSPLWTLVPVENAAMADRTILQWDKDDLDTLRLLKVDCLALGMLTCIRKALELITLHRGRVLSPATIPAEDPETYEMISRADTIGVFQIESRAQQSFLPRMKPKCFYDLVIEVGIVRPGPIQGGMIHPFLRRRQGLEEATYPNDQIRAIYERTLGIPLFQEQIMRVAIVAAGYEPGEADQLRRAMAAWKRHGTMDQHRQRIISGMLARGYSESYAEETFQAILGFSGYGFPESHAASFALLTYASCWLKCHEPAAFVCALLNSQPMGFYTTSQLTQDVRRHGVQVRPVDVDVSRLDNTLEACRQSAGGLAIRLGLREIAGLGGDAAARIQTARSDGPFKDVQDLVRRASLDAGARRALADAGALASLTGHRHAARWQVAGVEPQLPLFAGSPAEVAVDLPAPGVAEDMADDYRSLGLTLGVHPLQLLRPELTRMRVKDSRQLRDLRNGAPARVAGLVTLRQRPATASGTTFVTLEDEHGNTQVIVWPDLAERQRRILLGARVLLAWGRWEQEEGAGNLIAAGMEDITPMAAAAPTSTRDFR